MLKFFSVFFDLMKSKFVIVGVAIATIIGAVFIIMSTNNASNSDLNEISSEIGETQETQQTEGKQVIIELSDSVTATGP